MSNGDGELKAAVKSLLEALQEAQAHLEFCGYGDSYERDVADSAKLPERIEAAISFGKGVL